jgi:hypothetical protein
VVDGPGVPARIEGEQPGVGESADRIPLEGLGAVVAGLLADLRVAGVGARRQWPDVIDLAAVLPEAELDGELIGSVALIDIAEAVAEDELLDRPPAG